MSGAMEVSTRKPSLIDLERQSERLLKDYPDQDLQAIGVEIVTGAVAEGEMSIEEGLKHLGEFAVVGRFQKRQTASNGTS